MNKELEKYISDIPLSNEQLEYYTKTKYITLSDLNNADDSIFNNDIDYKILFEPNNKTSIGHWTLLIRHNHNTFEYYNSIGTTKKQIPIEVLKFIQNLNNDKVKLYYNNKHLQ